MATGPINCFGDVSRVNRPHSVWKISRAISMFFCDAQRDRLAERPA